MDKVVGRDVQLGALREKFANAGNGNSGVVLIHGEPGSGKTTLIDAFLADIASDDARAVKVWCSPRAEGAFSAFRSAVRALVEGDGKPSRARKVAGSTSRALLELGPEFVSLIFPPAAAAGAVGRYLLEKSGVLTSTGATARVDYAESARDPFSDFVEFFRSLDGSVTYVVVIDDLHWADEASMALFGRLAAALHHDPSSPILLVGSYRTHEVTAPQSHPLRSILHEVTRNWGNVAIDLDSATDADRQRFTEMVVDILAPGLDDADFSQRLYEQSGGLPLYVADLVEMMIQSGDLAQDETGRFRLSDEIDWDRVPDRLEAAISERIDHLSAEAQEVLSMASIVGLDFNAEVLSNAMGWEMSEVVRVLSAELVRGQGLVESLGRSDDEIGVFLFRFRHREYLRSMYDRLTLAEQALGHEAVAGAILEVYRGSESVVALDVAEHLKSAGRPGRAAPWFLRSAKDAEGADALRDALSVALLGLEDGRRIEPPVEAELRLIAGRACDRIGAYIDALPHLLRAKEIAEAEGLEWVLVRTLILLGVISWRRNQDAEAFGYLRTGLVLAEAIPDPESQAQALRNLGILARRRRSVSKALVWYERSESIAREHEISRSVTAAINNRAYLYLSLLGDFRAAKAMYEEALEIATAAGNRSGMVIYLLNLSGAISRLGDQVTALKLARQSVDTASYIGSRRRQGLSWGEVGHAERRRGEWDEATNAYERAIDILTGYAGSDPHARSFVGLAIALAYSGRPLEESVAYCRQGIGVLGTSGAEWQRDTILAPRTILAVFLARSGDVAAAVTNLRSGRQIIESGDDPWWMRWQDAMATVVHAGLTNDEQLCASAIKRLRLASAVVSDGGILVDAAQVIDLLAPAVENGQFIRELRSVLERPPTRASVASSFETDTDRLNGLANRYRDVLAVSRVERYRTPLGGGQTRDIAIEGLLRGESPIFEYEAVPSEFDASLESLLRDIDPSLSVWDELIFESAEDYLHIVRAAMTRDADALTAASIGAFGEPSDHLFRIARDILASDGEDQEEQRTVSASEAADAMESQLRRLGLTSWTVEVTPTMNAHMSVSFATDTLRVKDGTWFTENAVKRLMVHEIGTHVFRAENGRAQSLSLLGMGLGRNTETDEGLAWYNEEQAGLVDSLTKRKYALRVLACRTAIEGSFADVYAELREYTDEEEAYEIAVRVKRGLEDTSVPGGYIKDHVYLQGLINVQDALAVNPDSYRLLMAAKVPLRLTDALEELDAAGLLVDPALLPGEIVQP